MLSKCHYNVLHYDKVPASRERMFQRMQKLLAARKIAPHIIAHAEALFSRRLEIKKV